MSEHVAYVNGAMALGAILLENHRFKIHMSVEREDEMLLAEVFAILSQYAEERKDFVKRGNSYSLDVWTNKLPEGVEVHSEDCNRFTKITLVCTDTSNFRHFLRGVLDSVGVVRYHYGPIVKIPTRIDDKRLVAFMTSLTQQCKIPFNLRDKNIEWAGANAIDLLSWVYDGATHTLDRTYNVYKELLWMGGRPLRQPTRLDNADNNYHRLGFHFAKSIPYAPAPSKVRTSDAGWDLHLVKKLKEENGVHFYTTGIRVQPPYGYYFEVVGRSSISKTGWMLANNVGVIDPGYTGDIIVALVRTRPDAPEFSLEDSKGNPTPVKLVQMLPKKLVCMKAMEVADLTQTSRADTGGLGSVQFKK